MNSSQTQSQQPSAFQTIINQLSLSQLSPSSKQELWQYYQKHHQKRKKRQLIPNLKRELSHGWLLPYLGQIDSLLWGRWLYWAKCQQMPQKAFYRWQWEIPFALVQGRNPELPSSVIEETLPDEPIPQIDFQYSRLTEQMLHDCLNSIPNNGSWQGWSAWTYLEYFLNWALYGFGHPGYPQLPKEPSECQGASMRLYQLFDLSLLLFYPEDYFGHILPNICSKKGQRNQGFYPTPLVLSKFLNDVVQKESYDSKVNRVQTCYEPSCGTGAILLPASNHTLCAISQDIDSILLKCALFQFYCFCPWFASPIWWLIDKTDLILGNSLTLLNLKSFNSAYWYEKWFNDDSTNYPISMNSTIKLQNNHHSNGNTEINQAQKLGSNKTEPNGKTEINQAQKLGSNKTEPNGKTEINQAQKLGSNKTEPNGKTEINQAQKSRSKKTKPNTESNSNKSPQQLSLFNIDS